MSISKQEYRQAINAALTAHGIDDLELEFAITERVFNLASGNGNTRRVTAAEVRQGALEAIGRGATLAEQVKGAVYDEFRINVNWSTRTGKQWLEWLIVRHKAGETISEFAAWWKAKDWRGREGQPPNIQQVYELWPQAFNAGEPEDPYAELRKAGYVIHSATA